MKIALIGYGKMGKAIETIALDRGNEVTAIIDIDNHDDWQSEGFRKADVAIEFTTPETAVENYYRCFEAGIPVVSGTTGWLSRLEEVKERCINGNHTMFYASNFSIGVNIFFALNRYLAQIMNHFQDYDVRMKELHHIHKKDAPSGTAITLAEGIIKNIDRKQQWTLGNGEGQGSDLPIEAVREGEIPGTHNIVYESGVDFIRIEHEAKSRHGFALGAVIAAEFTCGKKGFLGMEDMLSL